MPQLTISLVVYNGERYLERCLASIAGQTFHDFELVVTDNASSDNSVEYTRACFPQCVLIELSENTGFARAHNRAIERSTAEYVLTLNQDAFLEPEYCERAVLFLSERARAGSATGTLWRVSDLHKCEKIKRDSAGIFIKRTLRTGNITKCGDGTLPQEVFGVSAACALYRRAALLDIAMPTEKGIEYFDEDFFMYKEDVDLAFRLVLRGWAAWHVPYAVAYHVGSTQPALLRRGSTFINTLSYRNHFFMLLKNVSAGLFIRCAAHFVLFELGKLFFLSMFEKKTLRGVGSVLKMRKKMLVKRRAIQTSRTVSDKKILSFFR